MSTTIKHGKIYVKTSAGWVQISLPNGISDIEGLQAALDTKINKSEILDGSNKIKKSYIPSSIINGITYGGTFNASTGVATLSSDAQYFLGTSEPTKTIATNEYATYQGLFFITQTAGTFATISYEQGDWLISTNSSWEKIDNTDAIQRVNGRTGVINIYQNTYNTGATYYKGDIVSYGNNLYICIVNSTTLDPTSSDWKAFGKDWTEKFDNMQTSINKLSSDLQSFPSYTVTNNTAPTASDTATVGSIWISISEE